MFGARSHKKSSIQLNNLISSAERQKEEKELEFLYAKFGAIGLETAYSAANTALMDELKLNELVEKFAIRPREILKLDVPKIEKGAKANLTLFHPKEEWVFSESDIKSKSRNSPFIGKKILFNIFTSLD